MTNTAVEIRNLTKVFDGKEVLRSCNLTVQSGTDYLVQTAQARPPCLS